MKIDIDQLSFSWNRMLTAVLCPALGCSQNHIKWDATECCSLVFRYTAERYQSLPSAIVLISAVYSWFSGGKVYASVFFCLFVFLSVVTTAWIYYWPIRREKKKKSENVVSFSSLTLLIFFFLLNTKAICYSHH